MRRGEEWALPARDRGPVKALARDYVDSKRRISEYYMYVMIAVIIVLFVRAASVQLYAEPVGAGADRVRAWWTPSSCGSA